MTPSLFDRLQQELAAREKVVGVTMADILQLPPVERQLMTWLVRAGSVPRAEVVAHWGHAEQSQSLLTGLIAKGFVHEYESSGELHYSARLAPRRQRELPVNIWQALIAKLGKKAEA